MKLIFNNKLISLSVFGEIFTFAQNCINEKGHNIFCCYRSVRSKFL